MMYWEETEDSTRASRDYWHVAQQLLSTPLSLAVAMRTARSAPALSVFRCEHNYARGFLRYRLGHGHVVARLAGHGAGGNLCLKRHGRSAVRPVHGCLLSVWSTEARTTGLGDSAE